MPQYDIDFEANGKQQRLTVEGARPPTSEEAGKLILQAIQQQASAPASPQPASPQGPPWWHMLPGMEVMQAVPALPQRAELPAEEIAPPLMGPAVGALQTRGVPTALLEGAATTLTPGPLKPVAGAVAAGAGELLEQGLHGEPLNLKKAGVEAGLSAIPEVAESAVRGAVRGFARNTRGGGMLRFDQAAQEARQVPERVFQPQSREQVGQMFDFVRQSGVRINTDIAEQEVKRLTAGKYEDLLSEAQLLDRQYATGGRYADLVTRLRTKSPQVTAGYDIGDLQQLRSGLRIRAEAVGTHEHRQLLRDFQHAVDDSIDAGMAVGRTPAGMAPQVLQQARVEYARLRAAEDMGHAVENAIRSSDNLAMERLNLRQFYDDLRRGRTEASRSINRALDLTPGARQRFDADLDEISRLYNTIEISMTDTAGIRRLPFVAGIAQGISTILLTETGRRLFRDAIVQGRGQLSPNAIALLANAARREAMPELGQGLSPVPAVQ